MTKKSRKKPEDVSDFRKIAVFTNGRKRHKMAAFQDSAYASKFGNDVNAWERVSLSCLTKAQVSRFPQKNLQREDLGKTIKQTQE